MRPQRFQEYALEAYRAAGLQAEPWQDGTSRPFGIRVTLPGGAQAAHAITFQSAEGEKYSEPEQPVEKDAPEALPVPDLGAGKPAAPQLELYLAALVNNAGSQEIARVWAYSDREHPPQNPGFGVEFHTGARAYCMFRT